MRIWAFDPGAVATGVAYLDITAKGTRIDWWCEQYADPVKAHNEWFWHGPNAPQTVTLIEGYRSAGHLTNTAKATIEIVGFLKYSCELQQREYKIRWEQQRLSGVEEAGNLMKTRGVRNVLDKTHKDALSALAHAIVYGRGYVTGAEEQGQQSRCRGSSGRQPGG